MSLGSAKKSTRFVPKAQMGASARQTIYFTVNKIMYRNPVGEIEMSEFKYKGIYLVSIIDITAESKSSKNRYWIPLTLDNATY